MVRSYRKEKIGDVKTQDPCLASTSAPSYFPLFHLKLDKKSYLAADGGLYATDPTPFVYSNLKKRVEQKRFPDKDFVFVSIGTGEGDPPLKDADAEDAGKYFWVQNIVTEMIDLNRSASGKLMKELKRNPRHKYYRFQIKIDPKYGDLDNASPEALAYYETAAEQMFKKFETQIREICALLKPTS